MALRLAELEAQTAELLPDREEMQTTINLGVGGAGTGGTGGQSNTANDNGKIFFPKNFNAGFQQGGTGAGGSGGAFIVK